MFGGVEEGRYDDKGVDIVVATTFELDFRGLGRGDVKVTTFIRYLDRRRLQSSILEEIDRSFGQEHVSLFAAKLCRLYFL